MISVFFTMDTDLYTSVFKICTEFSLEVKSESVNENKKSFKCSFCDYCCPKKCDLKKY